MSSEEYLQLTTHVIPVYTPRQGTSSSMVAQNMLRTHEGKKGLFREQKIRCVTALDLRKCLKQIK